MNKDELDIYLNKIKNSQSDFTYNYEEIAKAIEQKNNRGSDIAVKILSGIGGVLSSLLLLGLLLVTELISKEIEFIIWGIIFTILAGSMNYWFDKIIMNTASISLYLIGLVLFGIGIVRMYSDDLGINILLCCLVLISILHILLSNNYIMMFISSIIIIGSISVCFYVNEITLFNNIFIVIIAAIFIFVSFYEAKIISFNKKLNYFYNPLQISLLISIIVLLITFGFSDKSDTVRDYFWIISTGIFGGIMYSVYKITELVNIKKQKYKYLIYAISFTIIAPTFFYPPIGGALLALLVSYYIGQKQGVVISILALTYFVIHYYYSMHNTLLTKSLILMVSGLILTLAYFAFLKYMKEDKG